MEKHEEDHPRSPQRHTRNPSAATTEPSVIITTREGTIMGTLNPSLMRICTSHFVHFHETKYKMSAMME
jgi:hypothetical protein